MTQRSISIVQPWEGAEAFRARPSLGFKSRPSVEALAAVTMPDPVQDALDRMLQAYRDLVQAVSREDLPSSVPADSRERLVVAEAARWFELPGGIRVGLDRRGAARRILRALVDLRVKDPGRALSLEGAFDAGWPGERAHPDSVAARVYTTVRILRNLGLRPWLIRSDQGYLLDPEAPVEYASAA
jgi:hypothetical protein